MLTQDLLVIGVEQCLLRNFYGTPKDASVNAAPKKYVVLLFKAAEMVFRALMNHMYCFLLYYNLRAWTMATTGNRCI